MECLEISNLRVRALNPRPRFPRQRHVLYWMTSARRLRWNFALGRALDAAAAFGKPLLIVETLDCGHRWANRRHHKFVIQGMVDNAATAAEWRLRYYPFVERAPGESQALLAALADSACLIVTDDFPIRRFEKMATTLAAVCPARVEAVDSNGLLPLWAAERAYPTAYAFRRFAQQILPRCLREFPACNPLSGVNLPRPAAVPHAVCQRWPALTTRASKAISPLLDTLPIDQSVREIETPGGSAAAAERLREFLAQRLTRYATDRNHPDADGASGLAPYLHHGHLAAHEVFSRIAAAEKWRPQRLAGPADGRREGWWRMSGPAEAFLDQLIVWREVGYNFCAQRGDYESFDTLPDWARTTLARHARDHRPTRYSPAELEQAATHDRVWNAAQRQLLDEGRLHNYLRMLWGKKILEWSATPRQALETMLELNNKYALDGENPNSYSGIFWVLGRYDRPWGPERPIFGTVRYMSSASTLRKVRMKRMLKAAAD